MPLRPLRDELRVLRNAVLLLEERERRQLAFLVPPMIAVGIFEVAGVASLAPFIALLAEPQRFTHHRVLRWLYSALAFDSIQQLFFFVGACVLVLLTVSNSIGALTTYALSRFSWMRNATLSTRLLGGYLHQPYPFFLEHSTPDLVRKAITDTHAVAVNVILQLASLCSRMVVILFITGTLVFIDPMLALSSLVVFGGMYGGLFLASRRLAARAGKERLEAETRRFRTSMEALNGAKEIKLYRLEDTVTKRFRADSVDAARSATRQLVVSQLPRYALETVAFGGVLVMILYLLHAKRSLQGMLPLLGLYAFAAMRLLPALQAVFAGLNSLMYNSPIVETLRKEFLALPPREPVFDASTRAAFEDSLELRDVTFAYATSPRPVLNGISLRVRRGEWVVLIGSTGSGKSTIVDLMLGLLEPTSGAIAIDGVILSGENRRAWQAVTAYVPQQIFLVNDSVEANVCFGVPPQEIDRDRLERAARLSQIHDFIVNELPQGYRTTVGDRGVRLSGGQRQRVGIARALYRSPKFLVLDEATSALDGATEAAFFAALRSELADCSVVSITHRLTTARSFDRAYRLERGTLGEELEPRHLAAEGAAAEMPEESPASTG